MAESTSNASVLSLAPTKVAGSDTLHSGPDIDQGAADLLPGESVQLYSKHKARLNFATLEKSVYVEGGASGEIF